jgi:hypothetical protein
MARSFMARCAKLQEINEFGGWHRQDGNPLRLPLMMRKAVMCALAMRMRLRWLELMLLAAA